MGAMIVASLLGLAVFSAENYASAGTYSVHQCDEQLGITTNSFVWQANGVPSPAQHANSGCLEFGLGARTSGFGTSRIYPVGAYGGYRAWAPSGATITRFSGFFGTLVNCCVSGMEIQAEVGERVDGSGSRAEIFSGSLGASSWQAPAGLGGPVQVTWTSEGSGFTAERIDYGLWCTDGEGCAQTTTGDIRVRGRSFEFTLDDYSKPELTNVGGSLLAEGWIRGTKTLAITAEDSGGGLAGLSASLGDESIVDAPSSCSVNADRYVDLRPCPLTRNGTWTIDTSTMDDGQSTLQIRADDVGGNTDDQAVLVSVDNTAPSAPADVALDGMRDWRSSNGFNLRWARSEEHAPIAVIHYEICRLPNGGCAVFTSPGIEDGNGDPVLHVDAPEPGVYDLRVWLEDAAGNVDPDSSSSGPVLKFDDSLPGRAKVGVPPGWRNGQGDDVGISLDPGSEDEGPVSGIGGYSVTTDGSAPDETFEVEGASAHVPIDGLPEGVTPVRARAISNSGVAASAVGAATIKIDRTPPVVRADGAPAPGLWYRQEVVGEIEGIDQVGLSGLDPAPSDRPLEEGGYLAIRLDGSSRVARGGRTTVPVTQDGRHTLAFRAFDAAGNGSVEKEVEFKIDRTAPTGSFRALDAADPRQLRVDVEDVTSGVEGGRIEYRREGEGGFARLATALRDGVLSARLDDESLPAGRYELRAVVTDVAGNEALIGSLASGSAATVSMPLRSEARITVAGDRPTAKGCAKASKKRRGNRNRRRRAAARKCRRRPASETSLELAHGKRAGSTGHLSTPQGVPIAGALVIAEGRARSGGAFVPLGTVRTDARGAFRLAIPAGPSRTVRYRYDGTNTVKPAVAQLVTKVRAAARLKASRRRLRNGQTVRFTGRLLGRPVPSGGKLVALQAKVGSRWRTFATPRANAKGLFRHRYRFTSTTGLRRYAFRAVIAREVAYPYERGVSRTLRVIVRGR